MVFVVMAEKKQARVTNEEYEGAFHELAVFLFEQYKKDKQNKLAESI